MNPVFAALQPVSREERARAYADPQWRAKALAGWKTGFGFGIRWDTYTIGESVTHPELVGRRLAEVAEERGTSVFDALLDLALEEPKLALRVTVVIANDDEPEVARLLVEEHCTLGLSDAGAHAGQLCDAPQATDLLGNWVRGRQVMTVEEAVRRLTSVQADLFGIVDRGTLRPGAWADVVVFDPDTVAPGPLRRVRDFPADSERLTADQPTGVHHVLVNGQAVVRDGALVETDARPGQVVRPAARDRGARV